MRILYAQFTCHFQFVSGFVIMILLLPLTQKSLNQTITCQLAFQWKINCLLRVAVDFFFISINDSYYLTENRLTECSEGNRDKTSLNTPFARRQLHPTTFNKYQT